jgi:hypothetical protein
VGAYRGPAIRRRGPSESRRRIALNASAAVRGSHAIASANNLLVSIVAFSSSAPCDRCAAHHRRRACTMTTVAKPASATRTPANTRPGAAPASLSTSGTPPGSESVDGMTRTLETSLNRGPWAPAGSLRVELSSNATRGATTTTRAATQRPRITAGTHRGGCPWKGRVAEPSTPFRRFVLRLDLGVRGPRRGPDAFCS